MLKVPVTASNSSREAVQAAFEEVYYARFKLRLPEIRAVLITLHTGVIGRREAVSLASLTGGVARAERVEDAQTESRQVFFDTWMETPIYARDRLPLGAKFDGPAILEQLDTTTVVEPNNQVEVDEVGNLVVSVPSAWEDQGA